MIPVTSSQIKSAAPSLITLSSSVIVCYILFAESEQFMESPPVNNLDIQSRFKIVGFLADITLAPTMRRALKTVPPEFLAPITKKHIRKYCGRDT
jgi:hypothetical protein